MEIIPSGQGNHIPYLQSNILAPEKLNRYINSQVTLLPLNS